MNTTLENHVADERQTRKKAGVRAFEQRYSTLLPLLKASGILYLVEQAPASKGGQQHLVFFRWAGGYLYVCQWPLLADGSVEHRDLPVEPELLAELMAEESGNWDKWVAAQAWKEKRRFWLGLRGVLAKAVLGALVLIVLTLYSFKRMDWAWLFLGIVLVPYVVLDTWLMRDQDRQFPEGMTPKPPHVLHYSEIENHGMQFQVDGAPGVNMGHKAVGN